MEILNKINMPKDVLDLYNNYLQQNNVRYIYYPKTNTFLDIEGCVENKYIIYLISNEKKEIALFTIMDLDNEGNNTLIHRWLMKNKLTEKLNIVDHINGIPFDNRIENLRVCTHSQNLYNCSKSINNKTGIKGICYYTNKEGSKFIVAQIEMKNENRREKIYYKRVPFGTEEQNDSTIQIMVQEMAEIRLTYHKEFAKN